MEVVNPFILKNKIGMVKFIDELCNVDFIDPTLIDSPEIDGNNNHGMNANKSASDSYIEEEIEDPAHDLALVHNICETHRNELEQLGSSSPGAKKLITILTILSQHKQYYNNLRRNAQHNINTTLV